MTKHNPMFGPEGREDPACPAERHRHTSRGWDTDGCRCPSTLAWYERHRQMVREWNARRSRAVSAETRVINRPGDAIDWRKGDQLDAEAIANGHMKSRVNINTRALAVRLIRLADRSLPDRDIAWRLSAAGQGRYVQTRQGTVYQPVSIRQVQRLQAAIGWHAVLEHGILPGRSGYFDDEKEGVARAQRLAAMSSRTNRGRIVHRAKQNNPEDRRSSIGRMLQDRGVDHARKVA